MPIDRSQLRIAAISAGITVVLAGVSTIAIAGADLGGLAYPASPIASDAPVSTPAQDSPMSAPETDVHISAGEASAAEASDLTESASATPPPEQSPAPSVYSPVDCSVHKCVALTFDDGPDAAVTPRVLNTLRETQTPATFFQMGKNIEGNEALLRRAINEGHVLGTHTWDHPQLPLLAPNDARWQITAPKDASNKATGLMPTLMRPPYGLFNNEVINITTASNDAIIMWDVDTEDWKNKNPQEILKRTMEGTHRGSIVLMHDVHPTTADALPQVIKSLREAGYTLVTIPNLLGSTQAGTIYYSAESNQ